VRAERGMTSVFSTINRSLRCEGTRRGRDSVSELMATEKLMLAAWLRRMSSSLSPALGSPPFSSGRASGSLAL
jgi:hypothetical protein